MTIKSWAYLGEVDFVSGGRKTLNLPRLGVLHQLMIRAAFRITNGGTGPSGLRAQTLARLFRRVEVAIQGRDYIWNLSGERLAALAFHDLGMVAMGMDATVVTTNSAATDYEIMLPLIFTFPPRYAYMVEDSAIDMRSGLEVNLNLEFATADCSDFFNTPNSAALSNVAVEVSGLYEDAVGVEKKYGLRTIDEIQVGLPATNTALQVTVDKGSGVMMRSLLLSTLVDNQYSDAIIDNRLIELLYGQKPITRNKGKHFKAINRHDKGIASPTGLYHIDQTLHGMSKSIIPTGGANADFVLKLDATKQSGTNEIIVLRDGFRALQIAAA